MSSAPQQQPVGYCTFTVPPANEYPRAGWGISCKLCSSKASANARCNVSATQSCAECGKFGLPCVVGDWALPPRPDRPVGPAKSGWTACTSCKNPRSCDRGIPCETCRSSGNLRCERQYYRGNFYRHIPGDDMYGYWMAQGPGHGPDGPDSWDFTGPWAEFQLPANYHVEYAFHHYQKHGWLNHWRGPQISRGIPEVVPQQGPIYVGPPPFTQRPIEMTYALVAGAPGPSGAPRTASLPVAQPALVPTQPGSSAPMAQRAVQFPSLPVPGNHQNTYVPNSHMISPSVPPLTAGGIVPHAMATPYSAHLVMPPDILRPQIPTLQTSVFAGSTLTQLAAFNISEYRAFLDGLLFGQCAPGRPSFSMMVDPALSSRRLPDPQQGGSFDNQSVITRQIPARHSLLPPLPQIASPQPLGFAPNQPEALIVQNEQFFRQHQLRIHTSWGVPICAPQRVDSNNLALLDIKQDIINTLNPSGVGIQSSTNIDRSGVSTIERPPSPGSLFQVLQEENMVLDPRHPAAPSSGRSPLAFIPKFRTWLPGAVGPTLATCNTCFKPTPGVCESTEHHPAGRIYVCSKCDDQSRLQLALMFNRFEIAKKLRRYACKNCTSSFLLNPAQLGNSGYDVYDFAVGPQTIAGYDPRSMTTDIWPDEGVQIRGGVHELFGTTGCPCADKLLDRRLCDPHRAQYFLDLLGRMYDIAIWRYQKYGTADICFVCLSAPPQMPGGPLADPDEAGRFWMCLICAGVCLGDPAAVAAKTYQGYCDT